MLYMLDTNICIYLLKNKPPGIREKLERIEFGNLAISSISVAELYFGIEKSRNPQKNLINLNKFLSPIIIIPFNIHAARIYGTIRNMLEKEGKLIGPNDMLIAAHALSTDSILVTNNIKEFKRVPKLKLENWVS